jgi:enoyl-CoA hydratase/carnithine racemase
MTAYDEIIYEVRAPVALITLNRPNQLNAWTIKMGREVKAAVGQAERDRNVIGIVITGAGRAFCAGADLGFLSDVAVAAAVTDDAEETLSAFTGVDSANEEDAAGWGEDFAGEYTYLMRVPKPIIAAINGPIAGMAVPMALSCDLRFMATDAVLTTAFSHRGLIAEYGSSWLLPRLVGSSVALDLLWSSRKVDGTEAERLGLVNRAVARNEVVDGAIDYVRDLADRASPTSLAIMKRQVYQQLHRGLGSAEAESRQLMLESFARPDFPEGVRSFLEKRLPKFAPL